ncbi:hypothetical protein LAZ67_X004328 [Cordylochernes scorpioides]|uniref:RNA-directed DNA polymerase n=1 Tax=Cordylochernes scorpioides TaxID=51811 RepID=A0ABY6LYY8_9ARAC|nr:hypothetical protein LAZ67_X004328 [Cordylochernes scorpioides]
MLILCGMPEDWDNVISTMCNLPESEFTSANIRRKLLAEAERRYATTNEGMGALSVRNSNKKQFPHEHQGSKTVRKCFGCGKTGHIARDCFKLKKNNGKQQEKGAIHQHHEAKNLHVMYNAAVVSEEDTWVIDSGATHHMTPNRRYFSTLNDENVGQVTTIDGTSHSNIGRGNAQVDLINNSGQLRSIVAQNAMFVPGIRHGVLSVLQIVENGHEVIFDKKGCHIYDNDHNLMIRAEKRGRLYLVRTAPSRFPESGECSNSIAQTNNFRKFPLNLWHQRLMHINYDTIVDMMKREVVIGLNCQAGKPDKCSDCMIGKSTKRLFLNLRSTKETQTLALVHCDLMGPFNIESWGGSRFVLTIIDDASRYTRRIRTDNGLEFCSSPWDIFTKAHGIVHERTMVYTPEQNGVAERMNRTLLNLVRSTVNSCNLPTASWAELTNTAAYLRNRVTNRHNEAKTPFELWFGKRPALQHLRAIGCETFVHVPKQRRNSKLQPRATKGILVGYSLQGRGWRIWIPEKRQVVESRNCVFKEEILYKQPKRERDTLPSVHFSSKEASFQEESNADQPVDRETEELIGTTGGIDQLSETLPENLRSHPMTLRSHGKTAESPEEDNCGGQINSTSAEDNNPTYEEAMNSPEVVNWIEAIEEERESLERHDVWQLLELPKGIKPLKCRWVLNKKINAVDGTTRYKARLVAKGFTQRRGIDYNEVYTPVSSFETIRLLTAIATEKDWFIDQFDSGRCCNKFLNKQLHEIGFQRNPIDPSIYEVELEEGRIILSIYVDDIFAISENQAARNKCRELLNSSFEVKYLGPISHMLGVSFKMSEDGSMTLSQSNYIEELLQRFRLQDAKGISTPMETNLDLSVRKNGNSNERLPYRELIGGLSYLSQRTRPDIAYAVGILSRYCDNYTRKHWEAGKRVLRYMKSTKDFGISYRSTGKPLIAFSDASWASDIVDRKGVSGHLIILAGAPIIWRSTKQTVTALSTMESEYIALSSAVKDITWYHFVREKISEEANELFYTTSAENPADFLTKPLARSQHEKYCRALMDYRNKRPAEVFPGGDMLDTSQRRHSSITRDRKDDVGTPPPTDWARQGVVEYSGLGRRQDGQGVVLQPEDPALQVRGPLDDCEGLPNKGPDAAAGPVPSKRIRKKKMAENPNNRLQKFNGSKSAIRPESWIKLYDFENNSLKEDEKIKNLMYYLTDSALEWYADEIISNPAIKRWEVVKEKLIQRFGSYNANPIVSASHRRLKREESIENYFQDKIRLLNQTHLTKEEKIHLLTDGLPNDWKDLIVAAQPTDATKWFHIAASIEQNRASIQFKPKNKIHLATKNNDNRKNVCPFWCPICSKKGIKIKHWVTDCEDYDPNYKKDRPNQNTSVKQVCGAPELLNVSTLTNTPTQGAFKLINISVEVNGIPAQAFVDTGATVSIINWRLFKRTRLQLQPNSDIHISQADGVTRTCGSLQTKVRIDKLIKPVTLHVMKNFKYPLLIGLDVASLFNLLIDVRDKTIYTKIDGLQNPILVNHLEEIREHELKELLEHNRNVFSQHAIDLGKVAIQHKIITKSEQPISLRPYRRPLKEYEEIAEQVKELLEHKLIRISDSPWAFPVVMVPKKDGNKRMCIDYRRLNEITLDDRQPLPHIQDMFDRLHGSRFFSTLDVAWGYWQIEMDPQSIQKTAFVTNDGHYEFLVMPFGLKNAASTFQRIIQHILGELLWKGTCSFQDDILVYTKTWQEHIELLSKVFDKLRQYNMKLKLSKCIFGRTEVKYLGHIISHNQLKPDPGKVKSIQDFPRPDTVKKVRQFMGLANYYRKFVKDFSKISFPLVRLTRKNQPFIWNEEIEESFAKLKMALSTKPVLAIYNPDYPSKVYTDASKYGIGAILTQIGPDNEEHVIAYYSKTLQPHQENYSAYEMECLAVIQATDHFHVYIENQPFEIITDHAALQWLFTMKKPKPKYFRWILSLSSKSCNIVHRSGKQQTHVDALSRLPVVNIATQELQEHQQNSDLSFLKNSHTHDGVVMIKQIRSRWKIKHDSHHPKYVFKEGDLVIRKIAFNDPRLIKTSPKYERPFVIQKKISDVTYDISLKDQKQARRVHISQL